MQEEERLPDDSAKAGGRPNGVGVAKGTLVPGYTRWLEDRRKMKIWEGGEGGRRKRERAEGGGKLGRVGEEEGENVGGREEKEN